MQPVYLLDDSLYVEVFFSEEDCDLEDNICLRVIESCKEEERIFRHDESQLYLTARQAQELAGALLAAIKESETGSLR
jgi:hypothetical protein